MNNVTAKTETLVQTWISARKYVERLEAQLEPARQELQKAKNELGKWLVPEGAETREVFNIWHGSGILQAQVINDAQDYTIKWRREPDGKDRLENGF